MIAYESLCQAIVDWKAGARPSASSSSMYTQNVQEGEAQAVEELESGMVEMDDVEYDDAGETGEAAQAAYSGEHDQAAYSGEHDQAAHSGEHDQAAYSGEHDQPAAEGSDEAAESYEDYDVAVEDDEEERG